MKGLLILAGVALILGGWGYSIFADYNAPETKAGQVGCGVMVAGLAVIIGGIVL